MSLTRTPTEEPTVTLSLNTISPEMPIFGVLLEIRDSPLPEFDPWDPDYQPTFEAIRTFTREMGALLGTVADYESDINDVARAGELNIAQIHHTALVDLRLQDVYEARLSAEAEEAAVQLRDELVEVYEMAHDPDPDTIMPPVADTQQSALAPEGYAETPAEFIELMKTLVPDADDTPPHAEVTITSVPAPEVREDDPLIVESAVENGLESASIFQRVLGGIRSLGVQPPRRYSPTLLAPDGGTEGVSTPSERAEDPETMRLRTDLVRTLTSTDAAHAALATPMDFLRLAGKGSDTAEGTRARRSTDAFAAFRHGTQRAREALGTDIAQHSTSAEEWLAAIEQGDAQVEAVRKLVHDTVQQAMNRAHLLAPCSGQVDCPATQHQHGCFADTLDVGRIEDDREAFITPITTEQIANAHDLPVEVLQSGAEWPVECPGDGCVGCSGCQYVDDGVSAEAVDREPKCLLCPPNAATPCCRTSRQNSMTQHNFEEFAKVFAAGPPVGVPVPSPIEVEQARREHLIGQITVPIEIWFCPNDDHKDVDWDERGVAHCMEINCDNTSQAHSRSKGQG